MLLLVRGLSLLRSSRNEIWSGYFSSCLGFCLLCMSSTELEIWKSSSSWFLLSFVLKSRLLRMKFYSLIPSASRPLNNSDSSSSLI